MKRIPVQVKVAFVLTLMVLLSINCYFLPTARIVNGDVEFYDLIKCSQCGKRNLPIYRVKTDAPKIALTFDAAWGNEDTTQILDILDANDVKATFFMTGGWVESFPDNVKDIAARGHELGNHSENHKYMTKLSDSKKSEEILKVHEKVKELTGIEMQVFRPPYGDYDNDVVTTAFKCGYYTIQWNVDSLDWKDYGVSNIIKTVTNHKSLQNGSIILLHNGAKYTAKALDELIKTLKAKGYEFVKISDLIYLNDFHMEPDGCQVKN